MSLLLSSIDSKALARIAMGLSIVVTMYLSCPVAEIVCPTKTSLSTKKSYEYEIFYMNGEYPQAGINPLKYAPIFMSYEIPQFLKNSPLSKAKKHPNFQVTCCLHFVTTNAVFAYIKSE